jgi:ABC-type branched-subunit amino acid transport system substrate-binding protein
MPFQDLCTSRTTLALVMMSILVIGGCNSLGTPSLSGAFGSSSGIDTVPPTPINSSVTGAPIVNAVAPTGMVLGQGKVRVGLLLPLSGSGQAADMALSEFQNPDIQILVKDDRGSVDGARQAVQSALSEGAELILGPLFSSAVVSSAPIAKASRVPMIAFSTDASVASAGVYLLSFMAEDEVSRLVRYALNQNRKSFAALIPDTPYGRLVEAQFQQEVAQRGGRVVMLERYSSTAALPAVMAKIAQVAGGASPQVDALFIPEQSERLVFVAQALTQAQINTSKVKVMGTGVWNEPRIFTESGLAGAWFVAPEQTGFNAFSKRYQARFGGEPGRIATIGYDAVSLAAALVRTQGDKRFSESVITNSAGFSGVDGVFRFQPDGTNDRALAIYEINNGTTRVISGAPRALGSGTSF